MESEFLRPISEVGWPAPFPSGVEFNAPARGPWNIVHTGMLLPESHQIFICAQGCLRGVILTAAEMGAMDRMSWVSVSENDLVNSRLESNVVEGCADIIRRLPRKPRAILIFLSCIHLFAGCRFSVILKQLRELFPDILFTDCYMNPTMRKSGLTPDQLMRRQLYSLLDTVPSRDPHTVNIIGNDRPTDESSELYQMLRDYHVQDLTRCRSWEEYEGHACATLNLTTLPAANAAAKALEKRLGMPWLYLPMSYDCTEIADGYSKLAKLLPDTTPPSREEATVESAFADLRRTIGDVPLELDYTATPRLLSLARSLLTHGFRVARIYTDAFLPEEERDFLWLRENAPTLLVNATVHPQMRFEHGNRPDTLAIGQKAAWFAGTRHFVNIVAGGGHFGYDGILRMIADITDAYHTEKDTETVIQHKGIGLPCCACP